MIVEKLIRRHPHVFGEEASIAAGNAVESPLETDGIDASQVLRNWDAIKAEERESAAGGPTSALDSVPFGQPALALAAQLQRRAERAGAPVELADEDGAHGDGTHRDGTHGDGAHDGADIGLELFALVARARAAGIDPESELRAAARRYRDRVRAWERSRLA